MNKVITEDIVKKALDESIDEFMLEEGAWSNLKNWYNNGNGKYIKNAVNGLKNAAAMYMDARTNGQWNNKYGIYANGTGKMTEMYYLNKWFNFHLNEIKNIAYYERNPNRAQTKLKWKIDPNTGEKTAEQTINNYNSIQEYVMQNVNAQNFNAWIKNYITNRKTLKCIDDYINNYASKITNLNDAISYLNTGTFLKNSPEYINNNRRDLYRSQLRQQQNTNSQPTQGQQPVGKKDPNRNLDNGVPNLIGGGTFKK